MAYKEIVKRDGEYNQVDYIGDTAGKTAIVNDGIIKDTDTYWDVQAGTIEVRFGGAWYSKPS